jgi:hypothetical protein
MTRSKSEKRVRPLAWLGSLRRCPFLRRPARRATTQRQRRKHIRTDVDRPAHRCIRIERLDVYGRADMATAGTRLAWMRACG